MASISRSHRGSTLSAGSQLGQCGRRTTRWVSSVLSAIRAGQEERWFAPPGRNCWESKSLVCSIGASGDVAGCRTREAVTEVRCGCSVTSKEQRKGCGTEDGALQAAVVACRAYSIETMIRQCQPCSVMEMHACGSGTCEPYMG